MAKKDEKKSLEETIKELNKRFGAGAVINGNNISDEVESFDSGSLGLNLALGKNVMGWPCGKIIDLYGWESCGKSTMMQTAVGNYQKKYKRKVLYLDGENSISPDYSRALGMNLDDLIVIQMDSNGGEAVYEKMVELVKTGEIGLVIVDSYNSILPKSILDGGAADSNIGRLAKMLGQVVAQSNTLATEHNTTFVYIGQVRQKVGVMYGSPDTPQGGVALRFFAHIRAEVTRSTTKDNSVMDGDDRLGNKTTVKIVKNKLSNPFTQASFSILYGIGVDKIGELIDIAKEMEVLKIRAEVVTFKEEKYSESDFRSMLEDDGFFEEVKSQIMDKFQPKEII